MIRRRCPYCDNYFTDLSTHLKLKHKDVQDVAFALKQDSKKRKQLFATIRNKGMEKTNKTECVKPDPTFERKRKRTSTKNARSVMCSNCRVVLLSKNMARHKRTCSDVSKIRAMDVVTIKTPNLSDSFKTQVLGTLRNDSLSDFIKKDEGILLIGMMRFDRLSKNKDKAMEIRRSVRSDMRRLASLYLRYVNSIDMFNKENIPALKIAIDKYSDDGDDVKAGLKVSIKFLIGNAAKILEGLLFNDKKDNEALVISSFLSVFKLLDHQLFGNAYYKINKTRLRQNRKPKELPLQDDLTMVRDYTMQCIEEITKKVLEFPEISDYVSLRNAVCARLTLFNARRGGEAARMLLSEFREAKNNEWLDSKAVQTVNDNDSLTVQLVQSKIAYLMGKGSKSLVPVIILNDSWKALEMIADKTTRSLVGIASDNPYVFAPVQSNTKDVCNHISGWHAITDICNKLNLQSRNRITATKNRHFVSTYYSNLELPENERELFYQHMGHSKSTNAENYQCPPALRELVTVGKHLAAIDKGKIEITTFRFNLMNRITV